MRIQINWRIWISNRLNVPTHNIFQIKCLFTTLNKWNLALIYVTKSQLEEVGFWNGQITVKVQNIVKVPNSGLFEKFFKKWLINLIKICNFRGWWSLYHRQNSLHFVITSCCQAQQGWEIILYALEDFYERLFGSLLRSLVATRLSSDENLIS